MAAERLQKIIAAAGIAARRKAEELITSGQVTVNGQVVTELGTKADPEHDHIKVSGKLLSAPERHVYLLLHKPKGYVTTVSDPEGRPTVMDLVRGIPTRVYPVGRLDYLSEGLLLLTNDGELAQKLTHASSHVPKVYLVKVSGNPSEEDIDKLRGGIKLPAERSPLKAEEGTPEWRRRSTAIHTAPARIELLRDAVNPWFEVTLVEGRNRQIRRMFEEIGHHVEKIRRVKYGPLDLNVEPGQFRYLTTREVALLRTPQRIEPLQPSKEKRVPEERPRAEFRKPQPRRDDKFRARASWHRSIATEPARSAPRRRL